MWRSIDSSICLLCRGAKNLCGLLYCPVMTRLRVYSKLVDIRREFLEGSSPPSIFVGRMGYPKVYVGPALPPLKGDTQVYDMPEAWLGKSLDELLEMRLSLIRGSTLMNIRDVNSSMVYKLQELTLSSKPIDTELVFEKPPRGSLLFDEHLPPQGPIAPLRGLRILENPRVEKVVEKVYGDTDLKASAAIVELYRSRVPVSRIQKLLSIGALGTKRWRRLVPTRWSITAVDGLISKKLVGEVKEYPHISDIVIFTRRYMRNFFVAILLPSSWSFEWMEAWFPSTTWNPRGINVVIEGDWEGFWGRTTYASIGGCYYAARLATVEYLSRIRRQAEVILLREIYEGFYLPIGVWFVRENLRKMFRSRPLKFSSLEEALKYVGKQTRVPIDTWIKESYLLGRAISQKKITEFIGGVP